MDDLFVSEEVMEDDPVISEAPIYLNTQLQPFVVQYPTRKRGDRSLEQNASLVRIKPESSMIEVDIASDIPVDLTDSERQVRWNGLNYQAFGGLLRPAGERYAVGKMVGDELHLTRVQKTAQLRPQFDHFNQQTKEEREQLAPKEEKPALIRSVQVSAKSASESVSRYSEVLDFYKNAAQETFTDYEMVEPTEEQLAALTSKQ